MCRAIYFEQIPGVKIGTLIWVTYRYRSSDSTYPNLSLCSLASHSAYLCFLLKPSLVSSYVLSPFAPLIPQPPNPVSSTSLMSLISYSPSSSAAHSHRSGCGILPALLSLSLLLFPSVLSTC